MRSQSSRDLKSSGISMGMTKGKSEGKSAAHGEQEVHGMANNRS